MTEATVNICEGCTDRSPVQEKKKGREHREGCKVCYKTSPEPNFSEATILAKTDVRAKRSTVYKCNSIC